MEALSTMLYKAGLDGVPVTIILSLVALVGWLTSYYAVHLAGDLLGSGWLRYVLGLPVVVGRLKVKRWLSDGWISAKSRAVACVAKCAPPPALLAGCAADCAQPGNEMYRLAAFSESGSR